MDGMKTRRSGPRRPIRIAYGKVLVPLLIQSFYRAAGGKSYANM
jgi:hypothetical protein